MAWHSWRKGVRIQNVVRRTVGGRKPQGQSLQTLFNVCPRRVLWPSKDWSVVHMRINGQLGRFLLSCIEFHHLLFWGHATSISPAASPWGPQTSEAAGKALFVWDVGPSSHTRQRVDAASSLDSVQAVPTPELEFTGETWTLNHRKASPPHRFSTLCPRNFTFEITSFLTEEPLDEGERGEWKSWLQAQHSKN